MNRVSETCGTMSMFQSVILVSEREIGEEDVFEETMVKNFPHLLKSLTYRCVKLKKAPSRISKKKTSPGHIITEILQVENQEKL